MYIQRYLSHLPAAGEVAIFDHPRKVWKVDKRRGRLDIITHLLDHVPYEPLAHRDVELPERPVPRDDEPALPMRRVPATY